MKYIIMCGGHYRKWYTPRQLTQVNGESIVERTIRLLRENGVEDISISSNNPVFKQFGLPVLVHENSYNSVAYNNSVGHWCDAFYPTNEPTCYVFGDVIFSPAAIRTIVETPTDDDTLTRIQPRSSNEYVLDSKTGELKQTFTPKSIAPAYYSEYSKVYDSKYRDIRRNFTGADRTQRLTALDAEVASHMSQWLKGNAKKYGYSFKEGGR